MICFWIGLITMDDLDYDAIGFKSGLEIHQQLNTKDKLFCRCEAKYRDEESGLELLRHMRPTLSEMGTYDRTALMEFKTKKQVHYQIYNDHICTYEIDDTPPFELNQTALDSALIISKQFNCEIVNEIHISRKQYLDGSIPAGFQRTGIVSVNGFIPYKDKKINITHICLEEDACREISDKGHHVVFRTDRLSIPLVEIITDKDMKTPKEVAEVAKILGRTMRFSGLVRRGEGSIRQDVNVSIDGAVRVEIKGVSDHRLIETWCRNEAWRQKNLLEFRDELVNRGATEADYEFEKLSKADVTDLIDREKVPAIKDTWKEEFSIWAVGLPHFQGLLPKLTHEHRTFADEFAGRLQVIACIDYEKNLIHSEELADVGLTEEDGKAIRNALGVPEDEVFVLLWANDMDIDTGIKEIGLRAQEATIGIPHETRQAFKDGTTGFERMLPGPDRMYPDTDSPPTPITPERLERIQARVPAPIWDVEQELLGLGIPEQVAMPLPVSSYYQIFTEMQEKGLPAKNTAVALLEDLKALRRKGVAVSLLSEEKLKEILGFIGENKATFEAFPILIEQAVKPENDGKNVEQLAEAAGIGPVSDSDIEAKIKAAHEKVGPKPNLNPLMGVVMAELRGSVDGAKVYEMAKKLTA